MTGCFGFFLDCWIADGAVNWIASTGVAESASELSEHRCSAVMLREKRSDTCDFIIQVETSPPADGRWRGPESSFICCVPAGLRCTRTCTCGETQWSATPPGWGPVPAAAPTGLGALIGLGENTHRFYFGWMLQQTSTTHHVQNRKSGGTRN